MVVTNIAYYSFPSFNKALERKSTLHLTTQENVKYCVSCFGFYERRVNKLVIIHLEYTQNVPQN